MPHTWQWYRDGAAIPGATARTYTRVGADSGKEITCLSTVNYGSDVLQSLTRAPDVAAAPISYTHTDLKSANDISGAWVSNQYTFTGVSIPNPGAGRLIEVYVGLHDNSDSIQGITVNGVSSGPPTASAESTDVARVYVFHATVPLGSSVDVVLLGNAGINAISAGIAVAEIFNGQVASTNTDVDNAGTPSTSLSLNQSSNPSDYVSGFGHVHNGDNWVWTGLTKLAADVDTRSNEWMTIAGASGATTITAANNDPLPAAAISTRYT